MGKQINLLGAEIQLARLSKMGDSQEKINEVINWEIFRAPIVRRVRKADNSRGGRPPWDEILMFKTTLLQDWNNLSDENTEYMINDRLRFQRFLGMELGEKAPDEKTIPVCRQTGGCSRSSLEKKECESFSRFSTDS